MEETTAVNCCNPNAYSPSSFKSQSAPADFTASFETPDLRNWFSSYVYQSPELNSSYCFEDSLLIEGEPKEVGLYVEDSEGEEDTGARCAGVRSDYTSRFAKKINVDGCCLHESSDAACDHQTEVKVPEYSDSLPSEPPDIRNWFSSYVYESPTLDTAEIGGSLPSTADSDGPDDSATQKEKTWMPIPTKTAVDFLADKSIQKDAFVKHRELVPCVKSGTVSAQQEIGIEDHETDLLANPEKLFLGGISRSIVEEASADESLDGNPAKVCEYLRLNDAGTMEMLQREESNGEGSALCYSRKRSSTNIGSPIKFNERCIDEADETEHKGDVIDAKSCSGWIMPSHKPKQGNSDSINRSASKDNGFPSAMKASASTKLKTTPKEHEQAESVGSPKVDKCMTPRKPLMEITNVCSSGSNEITGKWRCPQKRKPCKGPPLKQLRLEKWVHRV